MEQKMRVVDRISNAIHAERLAWKRRVSEPGDDLETALARASLMAIKDLPEIVGMRYEAGEYSRQNIEAFAEDALTAD